MENCTSSTIDNPTAVKGVETPLRTELRQCFVKALKPSEATKNAQRRKKVCQIYYGEALTSDDVLERLQQEEEEKRQKAKKSSRHNKSSKGIPADEDHCQICGDEFLEGDEGACLGCDNCWRWVHCYCAGLDTPEENTPWLCSNCSTIYGVTTVNLTASQIICDSCIFMLP